MAVTPRSLGNVYGGYNGVTLNLPVANGVTVTAGDFVYMSSGRITSATIAGARIIGQASSTGTGNAAGTVKVLIFADPDQRFLIQNDNIGTTFAASHVGQYFDLIGATGAQLVDTSTVSATVGQMICLEYNPAIDPIRTDTTFGVFKIAEAAASQTSS